MGKTALSKILESVEKVRDAYLRPNKALPTRLRHPDGAKGPAVVSVAKWVGCAHRDRQGRQRLVDEQVTLQSLTTGAACAGAWLWG